MLCQVMIFVLGAVAVTLLSCKNKWLHWLSFVVLLCSEPFWFWTTIVHCQWGMLLLSCLYTIMLVRGAFNYYPRRGLRDGG